MRLISHFLCQVLSPGYIPHSFETMWVNHETFPSLKEPCFNEELNIEVRHNSSYACKLQLDAELPQELHARGDDEGGGEGIVHLFNCGLHMLHLGEARPMEFLADTLLLEARLQDIAAEAQKVRYGMQGGMHACSWMGHATAGAMMRASCQEGLDCCWWLVHACMRMCTRCTAL